MMTSVILSDHHCTAVQSSIEFGTHSRDGFLLKCHNRRIVNREELLYL